MKILILNWRDIRNPTSGGAEILTHEMAKRWAKWGNEVIQLSSGFQKSLKEEVVDGVKIIRMGKWWSVHVLIFFYYITNFRNKVDVIIDEVHWFPFFSTIYAPRKIVLLACEVANNLFFELLPYVFALLGRAIEKIYLWFYKNVPTLAISQSTKNDLIKEGFLEKNITVLPMGITAPINFKLSAKEKVPTLIYVGRINRLKGIDDAIDAFFAVKKKVPNCKLWIVGKGEESYANKIKSKISSLGIKPSIIFFGFVTEEKKFELMSKAHILLSPSVQEGWGLTISEAGLCGTPSVAYDVSGLHDVVKNNVSGVIVDKDPNRMAEAVEKLLRQKDLYDKFQNQAIFLAKNQSWDRTAEVALGVFDKLIDLKR